MLKVGFIFLLLQQNWFKIGTDVDIDFLYVFLDDKPKVVVTGAKDDRVNLFEGDSVSLNCEGHGEYLISFVDCSYQQFWRLWKIFILFCIISKMYYIDIMGLKGVIGGMGTAYSW